LLNLKAAKKQQTRPLIKHITMNKLPLFLNDLKNELLYLAKTKQSRKQYETAKKRTSKEILKLTKI